MLCMDEHVQLIPTIHSFAFLGSCIRTLIGEITFLKFQEGCPIYFSQQKLFPMIHSVVLYGYVVHSLLFVTDGCKFLNVQEMFITGNVLSPKWCVRTAEITNESTVVPAGE